MKKNLLVATIFVFMLVLSACSSDGQNTQTPEPQNTVVSQDTETPIPEPTLETIVNTDDPIITTQVTVTLSSQEAIEIIHQSIPGEPSFAKDQKINDCSTGERIALGATTLIGSGCDIWNKGKFERPADTINGTYFAAVDIVRASMGNNQDWFFAKIELYQSASGNIPEELTAGFELDTDLDSRGEYLILASGITSNDWVTNGVQVWQDANGDVGGNKPHSPDGAAGDGFETLIFDSGSGNDADLAWVRIDQFNRSNIEFAFKPSLVPESRLFAWWVWTSLEGFNPQIMEMVDSQAESDIWKIDNTCGWIYNGNPTKMLANICDFVIPTATPSPTATRSPEDPGSSGSGCPPGYVWSNRYNQCVDENPN